MAHTTRPTIGFLTANIHVGAARALWPGVLDAAQAGDANLICYPGGRLHASEAFEAERNVLHRLVDTEHLAGLVSWTSALAGTVTSEEVAGFHQRYHPLPVVSLASPLPHSPLVSINDCEGMRALLFHLFDVHGLRRVALIRGPDGHPYALERYQAYLDTLKEKGLWPDPALITPAVSWENGADAMRVLLDERRLSPGVDFQAVVAVSDLLAIDALTVMAERGIRVPTDVAVVGFNDIEEGQLVSPPLTSVALPFYEQGRRSVEVLLAMLSGEDVPAHTSLGSRLLVRQSCGCPSRSIDQAAVDPVAGDSRDLPLALKAVQKPLVEQISRVAGQELAAQWAGRLTHVLHQEITAGSKGQFLARLDSLLHHATLDGDQIAAWQSAVSVMRRELLSALDSSMQLWAENLFGQARVMIGEASRRAQIARRLQSEHQSRVLRDMGQALITTFDVNRLADVLAGRIPDLGIESCYLALYENPLESIEWSRLALAYSEGRRIDPQMVGRRFPSRQLVPADLLPARRYSLVVEPLYFQSEPIGFAVFEIGPRDGATYEVLRGHISSALKGALLFREAHEARLVAERADHIKTRLLANVSHELRTPLNVIIGHAQRLLSAPSSPDVARDLEHIQHSAEHQLRIINDLLDLSRAEINALDLYPVMLDPKTLIEDTFSALAENAGVSGDVTWQLQLPDSLPMIEADPVRLRQILLNLLSNAARFTEQGQITLGAEPASTRLHMWVADTGIGIPSELRDRIYEPFFTHEQAGEPTRGIGLGLSITRHLVALHDGVLELDSQPGRGSTFHIYLPLPGPDDHPVPVPQATRSTLWLISNTETPPAEMIDFSQSRQLAIRRLETEEDLAAKLSEEPPAVVAWDMASTLFSNWQMIHRLHNHPQLSQVPLILYQQESGGEVAAGLTSLVVKPASSQALWEAIRPAAPQEKAGSILIVDDDAQARKMAYDAARRGFPGYTIRTAGDGQAGLAAITEDPPSLVILDLMMPGMDGYEVLDRMRADAHTRRVPVVILTGRQLSLDDVKRLERHAAVTLQSKGILSEDEMVAALHHTLFGTNALPPQTSALVKRATALLQQRFARPLARREIAGEIGVSEDYLSRMFNRELGISPWDYLNRYRVLQARKLLHLTDDSIKQIGKRVGFSDPAYFSRVFRRITGMSPRTYRDLPDDLDS